MAAFPGTATGLGGSLARWLSQNRSAHQASCRQKLRLAAKHGLSPGARGL